jgi:homoserine O-acetyltransferase
MDAVDRLYAGYGEQAGGGMRGGRQGKLLAAGNAWLDADFPKLDRLLRVRILEEPR